MNEPDMNWRWLLKQALPPFVADALRWLRDALIPNRDGLEYTAEEWKPEVAEKLGRDYETNSVVEGERSCWEPFIAHLRDSVSRQPTDAWQFLTRNCTVEDHNMYITYGYVLALAASGRRSLRILDYGGNLGYFFWIGRLLLPQVEFEYHCKELPAMAEAGRRINPEVVWYTDDRCLDEHYDVVMFNASFQYIRDWEGVLRRAAAAARPYLYLTRLSTVENLPTSIAVQRYRGMTVFNQQLNRDRVLSVVNSMGLNLVGDFLVGPHPRIRKAPEQPKYQGWLFKRALEPATA